MRKLLTWKIISFMYFYVLWKVENNSGLELGYNGIPKIACKVKIYVSCEKFTVILDGSMWDTIKTKQKR